MKVSTLIQCARAARLSLAEACDDYEMAFRQGRNIRELDVLWNMVERRSRQQELFELSAYRRARDLGV